MKKGVKLMDGWQIIQECEINGLTGYYNKRQFMAAIEHMSHNDFNLFCKTYHLFPATRLMVKEVTEAGYISAHLNRSTFSFSWQTASQQVQLIPQLTIPFKNYF
jgi:hypothetical protein